MRINSSVLAKLMLFLVVFSLALSSVSAVITLGDLENEFTCTTSNPYTLRYFGNPITTVDVGPLTLIVNSPVGTPNINDWDTHFKEVSSYTTTCFPGRLAASMDHRPHNQGSVYFGGFLYVKEPISDYSVWFQVKGRPDRKYANIDGSFSISSISDMRVSTLQSSFSTYGDTFKDLLTPISHVFENTLRARDGDTRSSVKSASPNLEPGIYFLQMAFESDFDGDRNRLANFWMFPIKFAAGDYDSDANLNQMPGTGYAVTNRPLSVAEMNSLLGSAMETEEVFCTAADGDHILTESDGICCGNTVSDEGMIVIDLSGVEQRCYDTADGWQWINDELQCEAEPHVGDFESSLLITYDANDGSDGCCGDDSLGDIVYVDNNWTYLCNNDLGTDDVIVEGGFESTGANNWWEAVESYQIHTDGTTDYVSNGEEWFECSPDNTNSNDNFLGTTETLPPPQGVTFDGDTCVGVMNSLVSAGVLLDIDPEGELFSQGTIQGNQEPHTCGVEANDDIENFFDIGNIYSCVNNCYFGEDQALSSYFADQDSLIDNLCQNGVSIPGCSNSQSGSSGYSFSTGLVSSILCDLNPETCLGESYESLDCGSISFQGNDGYLCTGENTFCESNEYFLSSDHDPSISQVCCRAPPGETTESVCQLAPQVENENVCEVYGGEWTETPDASQCISVNPNAEQGNCCLGGTWLSTDDTLSFGDPSEAFLCSEWTTDDRFIECCGNSQICNAAESTSVFYDSTDFGNGMYATVGGSNFQIESFDKYIEYEVNRNTQIEVIDLNNDFEFFVSGNTVSHRDVNKWAAFTHLEFDFMYNVELETNSYYLTFVWSSTPEGEEYEYPVDITDYLVDGTSAFDMHHAIIPLPTLPLSPMRYAKKLVFSTENNASLTIRLDNIYLSGGAQNSDNYFCTGNFGSWVNNLDGTTDNGFASDAPLLEYAAHREACNGVDSFGWTGRLCCGDDTTLLSAENYVDENAGCFEGNKIKNNAIVGSTLYNEDYDDLMYYETSFHQCALISGSVFYSTDYSTSTDGNYIGDEFVQLHYIGDQEGVYDCVQNEFGYPIWNRSPELYCELSGQHDYLTDDEFNTLVLAIDGYNTSSDARCCMQNDVNFANDDTIEDDSGFINGDQECYYHPVSNTYSWESDFVGGNGFCETQLGGASLANFEDYGLSPNEACCVENTIGTSATLDGETHYICLQDELPTQVGYTTTPSEEADFYWWDARLNTHQIHIAQEGEYLSAGEEWLLCGDETNGVAYGDNPPLEADPNCLDTINTITVEEGFAYLENDTLSFSLCAGTNEYCCDASTYTRNNFISTQEQADANDPSTWSSCDANCYVREDETLFAYRNSILEETNFNTFIIENYPNEAFSIEQSGESSTTEEDQTSSANEEPLWNVQCLNYEGDQEGEPQICASSQVCIADFYFSSYETNNLNTGYCCVGEGDICRDVPELEDSTQQLCDVYSGDWWPFELTANDECSSGYFSGNCCYMGSWQLAIQNIAGLVNPSISEGFICHQRGEQNWFSECCIGPNCEGLQPSALFNNIQDSQETPINGIYSLGDSTNTLENFDEASLSAITKTYHEATVTNELPLTISFVDNGRTVGDLSDASGLYFNVVYNADFLQFVNLYDDQGRKTAFIFEEAQTSTNGPFVWNSVYLDLNAPQFEHPNFDWSTVSTFEITVSSVNPVTIQVDTLRIKTSEEYYCAGEFGSWIGDLDGLTQSLELNNYEGEDAILETIKYQETCKAAGHTYGWTGMLCCGDDTTTLTTEYYAENQAGCFAGTKVISGDVVGDIVNQEEQEHLLFYQGEFYRCDESEAVNRPNITIYDNLITTSDPLVSEENKKQQFDTVGSFMCTPDGTWLELGEVSKSKLLASKLYDLIKDETSYAIHCDSIDEVSPQELDESLTYFSEEVIETFCVAQIFEEQPANNQGNRTIVGFSLVDDLSVSEFLSSYANYLASIYLIENSEEAITTFGEACDTISPSSPDEFFLACEPQGNGDSIRILYNPEYNVLFVSQLQNTVDFSGLFVVDSLRDYVQSILHFFTNVFTGWYTERIDEEVDRRLPDLFTESDYDLQQIIMKGDRLANGSYKEIVGFIEEDNELGESIVAVEFTNFETNVQPLAYRYYGAADELNYLRGTNRQVIQINTVLADERTYSFEPAFDWRLFSAALRIDSAYDGEAHAFITSELYDGVLDIGEDCDTGTITLYDEEGNEYEENITVFKHGESTCGEWNSAVYFNEEYNQNVEVFCSYGLINYTPCNYCGDLQTAGDEQCDDGNTIDGDGCSASCLLEFCGDGSVSQYEFCDAGDQSLADYSPDVCDPAIHCDETCTYYSPCLGDGICQAEESCEVDSNLTAHVDCGYCDEDGDGFDVASAPGVVLDCNDDDNQVYPGATEVCSPYTFQDNDCDGLNDIDDPDVAMIQGYADFDADTFGNATNSTYFCETLDVGYVADYYDCNDNNDQVYPGATELCDGIDNNCINGITDEIQSTFYEDVDDDGYGNDTQTQYSCGVPEGYVSDGGDCNDNNNSVHDVIIGYEDNDNDGWVGYLEIYQFGQNYDLPSYAQEFCIADASELVYPYIVPTILPPEGIDCDGDTNHDYSNDCTSSSHCPNSIVESGEECDDGNTVNGDGCSSTCQIEGSGACSGNYEFVSVNACFNAATIGSGECFSCSYNSETGCVDLTYATEGEAAGQTYSYICDEDE